MYFLVFLLVQQVLSSNLRKSSQQSNPLIIAHRGASGYLPPHSLQAYSTAFQMNADYIEVDLVPTLDNRLIAMHDNRLSIATDIYSFPIFQDRRSIKAVYGQNFTDWFSEDFTLEEIQMLKLKQYEVQDQRSFEFDGMFFIPTLEQVIEHLVVLNQKRKQLLPDSKPTGLYLETKNTQYYKNLNIDVNQLLLDILKKYKVDQQDNGIFPVIIENFEMEGLQFFQQHSNLTRIFLYPTDSKIRLDEIKSFAHGVGPNVQLLFDSKNQSTSFVENCHNEGLIVHPYTIRDDQLQFADTPSQQYRLLLQMQVDGFFTEFPDNAFIAIHNFQQENQEIQILKHFFTQLNIITFFQQFF